MNFIKNLLPDKYESLALFLFILALTVFAEWLSRRAINRFIRKNSLDINNDPTNYKFLANALRGIIYSIGIMFAVREYPPLSSVASSLLAGAGIFAVAKQNQWQPQKYPHQLTMNSLLNLTADIRAQQT